MGKFVLKNLEKTFENLDDNNTLFKNINLEILDNKITVILGKSGSGKTTLLRIIAGLEKISSGEIKYFDDTEKEIKDFKIGFVFQESRLMPWLTVSENIKIHDLENKITSLEIDNLLDLVSLKNCKNLLPRSAV